MKDIEIKLDTTPEEQLAIDNLERIGVDPSILLSGPRDYSGICLVCGDVDHRYQPSGDDKYLCFNCGCTVRKDGQSVAHPKFLSGIFRFGDKYISNK